LPLERNVVRVAGQAYRNRRGCGPRVQLARLPSWRTQAVARPRCCAAAFYGACSSAKLRREWCILPCCNKVVMPAGKMPPRFAQRKDGDTVSRDVLTDIGVQRSIRSRTRSLHPRASCLITSLQEPGRKEQRLTRGCWHGIRWHTGDMRTSGTRATVKCRGTTPSGYNRRCQER